jgi:hypothetical protein
MIERKLKKPFALCFVEDNLHLDLHLDLN